MGISAATQTVQSNNTCSTISAFERTMLFDVSRGMSLSSSKIWLRVSFGIEKSSKSS
ncbi:hypothetical protein HanXRQr2_Chr11g0495611 [Helianthus annuus]|uniref:Uncharacterized protein n=1 Tax=Helianthus annuus TaxID=4232 RepID=A0A9K3HQ94_HELAN|nr:hypothetical protein HanXRQr2_Chr11g0495611 [Helianthus annuus]KAJ0875541.1 hypothetical protein HanPSC8_Chr11g0477611 [Helianthus annuus]